MTRKEAKALGLKVYLGTPCKRGHSGEQYVSDGRCVECRKAYEAAHREERKARDAAHREANKEKRKAYDAAHREERKAYIAAYDAAHKEEKKTRDKAWREANPDKENARAAKKRARKLAATPKLTPAEKKHVDALYAAARVLSDLTGEPYHVDHIKALAKGGLHHPDNLRILRGADNVRKHTRDADAVPVAFELRDVDARHLKQ